MDNNESSPDYDSENKSDNIDNMPSRPLRLHEVRQIEEKNDSVRTSEPVYYEGNNINSAICIMIDTGGKAHILGFDKDEMSWFELTGIDDEDRNVDRYDEESDSVVEWIEKRYEDDGFGVYSI